MKVNIKPLSNYVLLKLLNPEEKTRGGIYLPDEAQEETHAAEVIAVGPGKVTDEGKTLKPLVKVGDTVLIKGKWAGENVKYEGIEYKMVSDNEILATIS